MSWGNHHAVPGHAWGGVMVLDQSERTTLQQTWPKAGEERIVRRKDTVVALKAQPFLNELRRPTQVMSLDLTQYISINGWCEDFGY